MEARHVYPRDKHVIILNTVSRILCLHRMLWAQCHSFVVAFWLALTSMQNQKAHSCRLASALVCCYYLIFSRWLFEVEWTSLRQDIVWCSSFHIDVSNGAFTRSRLQKSIHCYKVIIYRNPSHVALSAAFAGVIQNFVLRVSTRERVVYISRYSSDNASLVQWFHVICWHKHNIWTRVYPPGLSFDKLI